MKIAFCIPRLVRHAGGTEQATAALIAQVARRHEVTIFSSAVQGLEGVPYHFRRVPTIPRPVVLEYLSFLLLCALLRCWLRLARGERFDIVHSPGINVFAADVITAHWCQAAALTQGQQLALDRHSLRHQLRRLTRALHRTTVVVSERLVYPRRAVRLVVCVSPSVEREIGRFYRRDRLRMRCIPNGVDLELFHPRRRQDARRAVRATLGLSDDTPLLLTVGGDWERKGVGTLIDALAGLPINTHLLVVGHGDAAGYKARAAALGCADRALFRPNTADVAPFYAAADIYVSPTRYEPFGLTPLEALASGVATIVSRCAGVSEWLTHGQDAWLLNDPTSVEELRDALAQLLADTALRERLAQAGRATAERFSWEQVGREYEVCYQDLVRQDQRTVDRPDHVVM